MDQEPIKLDYEPPEVGGPLWGLSPGTQAVLGFGLCMWVNLLIVSLAAFTPIGGGIAISAIPLCVAVSIIAYRNLHWDFFPAGTFAGLMLTCAVGVLWGAISGWPWTWD